MKTIAGRYKSTVEALRAKDLLLVQGFKLCRVTCDATWIPCSAADPVPFMNGFTRYNDEGNFSAQDARVYGLLEDEATVLIDVKDTEFDEASARLLRCGATNVRQSLPEPETC